MHEKREALRFLHICLASVLNLRSPDDSQLPGTALDKLALMLFGNQARSPWRTHHRLPSSRWSKSTTTTEELHQEPFVPVRSFEQHTVSGSCMLILGSLM